MAQKVLVVHSPHAGRAHELTRALEYLRQERLEILDVLSIAELDELPPQGARWQEQGVTLVVAAGGDGLVGGVVTHIAESDLSLGILPLGTANDIARSLALPQNIEGASQVLAASNTQMIDVGVARPAEQAPHTAQKQGGSAFPMKKAIAVQQKGYFVHALTVGVNVQFARLATNVATRHRYGRMTYPFAALEVLRNHTALDVHLSFEGLIMYPAMTEKPEQPSPTFSASPLSLQCRALQVAVINAPIFGGQWQLAIPGASLFDDLLDIVVIEDVELGSLSTAFARLFSQQEQRAEATDSWHRRNPMLHPAELTGIPGVHHVRAKGVTIITNTDPQDVTLDGEVRGQTPLHTHLSPRQVRVVVP